MALSPRLAIIVQALVGLAQQCETVFQKVATLNPNLVPSLSCQFVFLTGKTCFGTSKNYL